MKAIFDTFLVMVKLYHLLKKVIRRYGGNTVATHRIVYCPYELNFQVYVRAFSLWYGTLTHKLQLYYKRKKILLPTTYKTVDDNVPGGNVCLQRRSSRFFASSKWPSDSSKVFNQARRTPRDGSCTMDQSGPNVCTAIY